MKVVAQRQGFYQGRRIRPGHVFEWDDKDPVGRWVKEVDPKKPIIQQMPVEARPKEAPVPDWKKFATDFDPNPMPAEGKFAKHDTRKPQGTGKAKEIAKNLIKKSKSIKKSKR